MKLTKLLLSAAAAAMLFAPPVMAQSAGTSATGTSNGMQGTPGQAGPSSGGGSMGAGAGGMHGTPGMSGATGMRSGDMPANGSGAGMAAPSSRAGGAMQR